MKTAVILAAFVFFLAAVYVYSHTTINVAAPCHRNAHGEEVCPPPYKHPATAKS
jgi:hypothetical protein